MDVATKNYVDAKKFTLEDGQVTTSKIANKSVSENKLFWTIHEESSIDNLTETGIYVIRGTSSNLNRNVPSLLMVYKTPDYINQTYMKDGLFLTRNRPNSSGSAWLDWSKFYLNIGKVNLPIFSVNNTDNTDVLKWVYNRKSSSTIPCLIEYNGFIYYPYLYSCTTEKLETTNGLGISIGSNKRAIDIIPVELVITKNSVQVKTDVNGCIDGKCISSLNGNKILKGTLNENALSVLHESKLFYSERNDLTSMSNGFWTTAIDYNGGALIQGNVSKNNTIYQIHIDHYGIKQRSKSLTGSWTNSWNYIYRRNPLRYVIDAGEITDSSSKVPITITAPSSTDSWVVHSFNSVLESIYTPYFYDNYEISLKFIYNGNTFECNHTSVFKRIIDGSPKYSVTFEVVGIGANNISKKVIFRVDAPSNTTNASECYCKVVNL